MTPLVSVDILRDVLTLCCSRLPSLYSTFLSPSTSPPTLHIPELPAPALSSLPPLSVSTPSTLPYSFIFRR